MIRKLFILTFMAIAFGFASFGVILIYSIYQGPPEINIDENTVIYDQNENVITVEQGVQNRDWVELDQISPYIKEAFIAAEDQHFYNHFGFDVPRIASAVYHNVISMDKVQGASSITQQYARNLFLTHQKTWTRKIQEALITVRLEVFQDKDEILEGYLNSIYFGHGQYGIQAASQYYFDKNADDLKLEEAALLAGIPRGPSVYSPLISYENAMNRQKWILERMNETGKITETAMHRAKRIDLRIAVSASNQEEEVGQYFTDYALRQAAKLTDIDRQTLEARGYQVYTTMDLDAQKKLEQTIEEQLPQDEELQIGAVTVAPSTGKIVAMQGGTNFDQTPFNRATRAERMTGSTFKPFLYYAALVYGFTPSTTLESRPTTFTLEDGTPYDATNYNDHFANRPVTLAQALAVSDNIYALKTNKYIGPENLVEVAQTFGIEGDLKPVLSAALGTTSASPLEMARAYSILANRGWSVSPYIVEKVVDRDGNIVYQHEPKAPKRLLEENHAFVLTHMLTGMFDDRLSDYMSVTGAGIANQLTQQYAGKSGTTDPDSWMIGFSPHYTTAVWSGYDDNRKIERIQDRQAPKKIWANYMERIHDGLAYETFSVPSGVVGVQMDPLTGQLEGPSCEDETRLTYYINGTEPKEKCSQ
ncbi:monofunctional biosynthetic peptidoglycan transglycosylase [Aquisalibacillus elongatus]|uniref:Monofunctional biosynthetic peptidoglycan transglycosylase n=1 Tax=Aquisalibacillus elongatus TaxID=485577 RepID=A0A3N5C6V8_9BACI|nr:monofunctional biosynthetic peptidoglycan transglycosylase [Aquisalibacillus elongatus]RPF54055.1 monofunctional biosynthetic peptidoglycan transglycosylase [Aquisalibacillus elongatus]